MHIKRTATTITFVVILMFLLLISEVCKGKEVLGTWFFLYYNIFCVCFNNKRNQ